MEFECTVRIQKPSGEEYVKKFDSFVSNFLKLQRGLLVATNLDVVDTTGATVTVGTNYTWGQHCNYYNYYNYSIYSSWG